MGCDPETTRAAEARSQHFERGLALAEQIRAAFAGVSLGNGVGLQQSIGLDDYADGETLEKLRAQDEKKDWQKISASALNSTGAGGGLCFFDAEGMRFHLPAYLIAELRGEYRFGMVFSLTHLNEYGMSQFSLLNAEQRQSIRGFLLHLLDDPDDEYRYDRDSIEKALESFWIEESSRSERGWKSDARLLASSVPLWNGMTFSKLVFEQLQESKIELASAPATFSRPHAISHCRFSSQPPAKGLPHG